MPDIRQTGVERSALQVERKRNVWKHHSSHHTQWHLAPCSGPSYLPDGWEFAIVTVKPPKGCSDREQRMRRRNHGQQLGVRFPRNVWLCELQQQNHALWPTFPSPDEGSGAKQAGDLLSAALIPRLPCVSPEHWLLKFMPENQKDCPCGKICFSKSQKRQQKQWPRERETGTP